MYPPIAHERDEKSRGLWPGGLDARTLRELIVVIEGNKGLVSLADMHKALGLMTRNSGKNWAIWGSLTGWRQSKPPTSYSK